jgi:hypothetical protein
VAQAEAPLVSHVNFNWNLRAAGRGEGEGRGEAGADLQSRVEQA